MVVVHKILDFISSTQTDTEAKNYLAQYLHSILYLLYTHCTVNIGNNLWTQMET